MSFRSSNTAGATNGNWLFDQSWYLAQNPEAAASGMDPLEDYRQVGAARGHHPHPLFDTSYYLDKYPDVARAGANPLDHFVEFGAAEGRSRIRCSTRFTIAASSKRRPYQGPVATRLNII